MQDFVEPHGDRRQEIVFIGQGLNDKAVSSALDGCLCLERDLRQVSLVGCLEVVMLLCLACSDCLVMTVLNHIFP